MIVLLLVFHPGSIDVVVKLVELVEHRIEEEMRGTRGALMYDGWSCNSTHYVRLYASYCTETPVRVHGTASMESVPVLTLIGLSPMSQTSDDCDEDSSGDEATTFNAEAHLKFFSDKLQFYGQDFKEWCACLIADNTNTNLRAAKLAGVSHVS